MEKYIALMYPNKVKEEFINLLIGKLGNVNPEQVAFRRRFEGNLYENMKHPTINLNETQQALVGKVEHMLFYKSGLLDVIMMLNSFSKGVKAVGGNKDSYTHDKQYQWTDKDGNEKLSHAGNLPKAHFRWDFGKRYVLDTKDLQSIAELVKPFLTKL